MTQTQKTTRTQADKHRDSMGLAKSSNGIIPFLQEEVAEYRDEVKQFRDGKLEEAVFMAFRLHQGVYGQRQPDAQMFRIKAPGGILTPEGLEAVGTIVERFVPLKKGHITTRENIQLHHMSLEDCATAMEILGEAGLSTREACANTVRNVVAPPSSGVCPDEVFDVMPYLAAYVRYAVRHPLTQNFPRKFKTAFNGCSDHDEIISPLHDLSFIAKERDGERGFKVLVGGGTSIMPRLGEELYDFVPVKDFLRVSEAIWRVFNRADMLRKNRMMARIKVLIHRIGFDAFKAMVEEELAQVGPIDPEPLMEVEEVYKETPPALVPESSNGVELPAPFLRWRESNATPQKQDGYALVYVTVPQGDIWVEQFPPLADIVREFTGGTARTTVEQNLVLRWVPVGRLFELWKALDAIGLGDPDHHSISNVISCPGTDSCKLGITSSMGLGRAVREEILTTNAEIFQDPLVKDMHVKISGCPNGCGQHHVANIGFHGAAMKGPSGQQIPSYELFLGGQYGSLADETNYGERLRRAKVPAKMVPKLVGMIAGHYRDNRNDGESFNDYLRRAGTDGIRALADKCADIPSLNGESQPLYMDWEKTEVYKVERGEGECAV